MRNFNSQESKNRFLADHYAQQAEKINVQNREELLEARAQDAAELAVKAFKQNRSLLIATITLGFLGLLVDILSNLDAILTNIALLLCK